MPRARSLVDTDTPTSDVPKKRAPRKRVTPVAETEESVAPKKRAPRRRATKVAAPVEVVEEEASVARLPDDTPARRAPTPLRAERESTKRSNRSLVAVVLVLVIFVGAGVAVGMTDRGQIDVVAVVNERNERVNRGEVRSGESTVTVPVQNTDVRPNGGLVPADPSLLPPPPVEPATTTATSSETAIDTATSSDATTPEAAPEEAAATSGDNPAPTPIDPTETVTS